MGKAMTRMKKIMKKTRFVRREHIMQMKQKMAIAMKKKAICLS
jgi:hypothetical protein